MIQIVMKPVLGRRWWTGIPVAALFNSRDLDLRVRGRRASHAEAKPMEAFETSVRKKADESGALTVSFDLEAWFENKEGSFGFVRVPQQSDLL